MCIKKVLLSVGAMAALMMTSMSYGLVINAMSGDNVMNIYNTPLNNATIIEKTNAIPLSFCSQQETWVTIYFVFQTSSNGNANYYLNIPSSSTCIFSNGTGSGITPPQMVRAMCNCSELENGLTNIAITYQ